MKISKIALASAVAFAFLAAGCASENNTVSEQKETTVKSTSYSSKLGTQSTKKDIKK